MVFLIAYAVSIIQLENQVNLQLQLIISKMAKVLEPIILYTLAIIPHQKYGMKFHQLKNAMQTNMVF